MFRISLIDGYFVFSLNGESEKLCVFYSNAKEIYSGIFPEKIFLEVEYKNV